MGSKIFHTCHDEEFFGRSSEIEEIYLHATSTLKPAYGIYLIGKRWIGKTELLKRVYHRLFGEQNKVVPIYYRFKSGCSAEEFADDFLRDFTKQYLAFLKRQPEIVTEDISVNKLERLLADGDMVYLSQFLTRHSISKKYDDRFAMLNNAVKAPHQTALHYNTPVFLMLDDFDLAAGMHLHERGSGIVKEFTKSLMSGSISYLVTGYTRKLFQGEPSPSSIEVMDLLGLSIEASMGLMQEMSGLYHINCDSEILAVAARQLDGNPVYMKSIIAAAQRSSRDLVTLKDFMDLYAEEVVDGNIGFSLSSVIQIKSLTALRILHACMKAKHGISEEELMENVKVADDRNEIRASIVNLCKLYLLEADCGLIKWIGDRVSEDYIHYRYETEVKGRSIAEAKTSIIRERLKQGFCIQGIAGYGKMEEESRWLLKMFNGQAVPRILFRNHDFLFRYNEKTYKTEDVVQEHDTVSLPQIVGCFDHEKSEHNQREFPILVGHGFNNRKYDSENEVTWIAGVKETLAAVHIGDVEHFIRECSIIVADIKATSVTRWVISKEGFTGEALKRLSVEGIYTTDAVQLRILRNLIEESGKRNGFQNTRQLASLKEFDIILPMSTKAELVAAKAVEEIGTEMGFDDYTITQIKTALVEACINAFEHSKVKRSKVYCRFIVGDDRLVLQIQNEGKDFEPILSPRAGDIYKPAGHIKRGWGIELMKQLMDEVRFEKMQGGTKLVMVKYRKKNGEEKHE